MKEVPALDGYLASADGHIYSVRSGFLRQLSERMHGGYLHVNVRHGQPVRLAKRPVHQLVLLAHQGPRPAGLEARHLNGVATDNRAVNLRWGTKRENALDQVRHGTAVAIRIGDAHPRTRISDAQVHAIRLRVAAGATYEEEARRLGCTALWVQRIVEGRARTRKREGYGNLPNLRLDDRPLPFARTSAG